MMAKFLDKQGVWMAWDYGNGPEVVNFVSEDPVAVMVHIQNEGMGFPGFWPERMSVPEALTWWRDHATEYIPRDNTQKLDGDGVLGGVHVQVARDDDGDDDGCGGSDDGGGLLHEVPGDADLEVLRLDVGVLGGLHDGSFRVGMGLIIVRVFFARSLHARV